MDITENDFMLVILFVILLLVLVLYLYLSPTIGAEMGMTGQKTYTGFRVNA